MSCCWCCCCCCRLVDANRPGLSDVPGHGQLSEAVVIRAVAASATPPLLALTAIRGRNHQHSCSFAPSRTTEATDCLLALVWPLRPGKGRGLCAERLTVTELTWEANSVPSNGIKCILAMLKSSLLLGLIRRAVARRARNPSTHSRARPARRLEPLSNRPMACASVSGLANRLRSRGAGATRACLGKT